MIDVRDLRFQYRSGVRPVIDGLTVDIEPGMFLAVVGPSGSGKSTLLRSLNGLIPGFYGGRLGGRVRVNGSDTRQTSTADLSRMIGFVGQEPESQTLFDIVEDEIAFGPENLGFDRTVIRRRVAESMRQMSIEHLSGRDVSTLSGGERQRVVIAATLAMGCKTIALDEPFSQIDPWAAPTLLATLRRLNRDGVTVIVAEHRIDQVLRYASHVLDFGSDRTQQSLQSLPDAIRGLAAQPSLASLARKLNWSETPFSVEEARRMHLSSGVEVRRPPAPARHASGSVSAVVTDATVRMGDTPILEGINFELREGAVTAIIGPNGSGKTTLLRAIAGLQPLKKGAVELADASKRAASGARSHDCVGYVPQHPAALFLGQSVREEVEIALDTRNEAEVTRVLRRFSLDALSDRFAYDLSGGERQRLAIAIATARRPKLLLLDEPTRGMDQQSRADLELVIRQLRDEGVSIVLATHDIDLVASLTDAAIILENGRIVRSGSPRDVLVADPVLTPLVSQVLGPDFLTLDDVQLATSDASERLETGIAVRPLR